MKYIEVNKTYRSKLVDKIIYYEELVLSIKIFRVLLNI